MFLPYQIYHFEVLFICSLGHENFFRNEICLVSRMTLKKINNHWIYNLLSFYPKKGCKWSAEPSLSLCLSLLSFLIYAFEVPFDIKCWLGLLGSRLVISIFKRICLAYSTNVFWVLFHRRISYLTSNSLWKGTK